jgi:hypothetical protein
MATVTRMDVHEPVARSQAASEHVCQFFDSDDSRADAVAAYVADGLRQGDRVMVVARPLHWATNGERLAAARLPDERELARGTLIVKDAMDTLRRLTRHGVPDAAAFDDLVGTAVRGLCEQGRLRAYGEMVDILAQRGELAEAMTLERLWNELTATASFSLMCGYAAGHFVAPATHRALRGICLAHTDVRRGERDALADWLLTAAHNVGSASALSN